MKRIGVVVFPGFQSVDMAAASFFEMANFKVPAHACEIHVVSEAGGAVKSAMGTAVHTIAFDPYTYEPIQWFHLFARSPPGLAHAQRPDRA
ncbi:hypothetical protein AB4156_22485 [Cupriavidus sp. 2MCAB6]|uniref:hypothetical protein n=1 Tax=Cupriavidus sp. 2MCAB6 TaxID=3232981 RepID=UPI003F90D20D